MRIVTRSTTSTAVIAFIWVTAALTGAAEPDLDRPVVFEPYAAEAGLPGPFQLPRAGFTANEEVAGPTLVHVRFPSPVVTDHAANNVVHAELFLPPAASDRPRPRPGVIFLHYLDGDLALPRLFCRSLSLGGVTALLVKMPYYHERRAGTDRRMVSSDPDETADAVRQAALDVRYARAYLAARPDVDPRRIGVAGISLGGIVGSLAFELEPRLDRGCFFLAGADLPTLLWDSSLTAKYRGDWERSGTTKARLEQAFADVDPASHAGRRAGRPALLLCGRGDTVMPASCTEALIAALSDEDSKPDVIWFDGGHKPQAADVADAMLRLVAFFNADDPRSTGGG